MTSLYQRIDKRLGGYLPGGVTPEQVKQNQQYQKQPQSLQEVTRPPTTSFTPYLPKTKPEPSQKIITSGGYSYVEPSTGKGYEVSPEGERKEIIPVTQKSSLITQPKEFLKNLSPTIQSYLYGEKGKEVVNEYFRIPVFGGTGASFSFGEVKQELVTSPSLAGRTAGQFVPTTPLGVASYGLIPYGFSKLPIAIRVTGSAVFSYLGGKQALNKNLLPEERIAGGIIAGLGGTGIASEFYPYISGTFGKVTSPIKIKDILGKPIDIISNVKSDYGKSFDIALIKPGDKPTGNIPAFQSTAYGFSKGYQKSYMGKIGTVVTSQATSIIKAGNTKLLRELYGTPWDIKTGFAQTRVSRSGVAEGFKDLFKIPENPLISFKINKPQITVFEKAKISKGEYGTFASKSFTPKPSTTELEVTTTSDIFGKNIGSTKLGLTKVDIFSGKLFRKGMSIPKGFTKISPSSLGIETTSGYSILSTSLGVSKLNFGISKSSTKTSNIVSPTKKSIISTDYFSPFPSKPSGFSGISTISPPISIGSPPSPPPSTPSPPYPTISKTSLISKSSGFSGFGTSFNFPVSKNFFNLGLEAKKPKRKGKKKKTRIKPSFTAQVFDIRGALPKGGAFGISPFQLRKIPKGSRNPYETKF